MSDQDYVYDEATGDWLSPSEAAERATVGAVKVVDSVGNPLADGDSVTLIKDLTVKGAGQTLKRGVMTADPFDVSRARADDGQQTDDRAGQQKVEGVGCGHARASRHGRAGDEPAGQAQQRDRGGHAHLDGSFKVLTTEDGRLNEHRHNADKGQQGRSPGDEWSVNGHGR